MGRTGRTRTYWDVLGRHRTYQGVRRHTTTSSIGTFSQQGSDAAACACVGCVHCNSCCIHTVEFV
eukprot:6196194-Alexandrium_andersonii.AAC.1